MPTRKGFGEGLMLAGKKDENVVALCADLTESTQVELNRKFFGQIFFEINLIFRLIDAAILLNLLENLMLILYFTK